MSTDWDNVTRIGKNVRSGGGTFTEKERVIKGKSALNAAQRSGAVVLTEKKYGGSNSASQGEGQRLTKVDRSDDITKVNYVGQKLGQTIRDNRQKLDPKTNQAQLAQRVNISAAQLQAYENGSAQPDQKVLGALERILKVKLRGNNIGEPFGPKKA